jgi:hypothetical protein
LFSLLFCGNLGLSSGLILNFHRPTLDDAVG